MRYFPTDTDVRWLFSTLTDAWRSQGSPGVPGRPSKVDCLARRFLTELVGCGCVSDTSSVMSLYCSRAAGALLEAPGVSRRLLMTVLLFADFSPTFRRLPAGCSPPRRLLADFSPTSRRLFSYSPTSRRLFADFSRRHFADFPPTSRRLYADFLPSRPPLADFSPTSCRLPAGCSSCSGDGDVCPCLASCTTASVRAGFFASFFAPGRIRSVSAGPRGALLRLGVGSRMMVFEWLRFGRRPGCCSVGEVC